MYFYRVAAHRLFYTVKPVLTCYSKQESALHVNVFTCVLKPVLPLFRGYSSICPLVKHELPHRFLPTTWLPPEELFFGFTPEKDKQLRMNSLYLTSRPRSDGTTPYLD